MSLGDRDPFNRDRFPSVTLQAATRGCPAQDRYSIHEQSRRLYGYVSCPDNTRRADLSTTSTE